MPTSKSRLRIRVTFGLAIAAIGPVPSVPAADLEWVSASRYRIRLSVDPRRPKRSCSPFTVDLDLRNALAERGGKGSVDEQTIEVVAYDEAGRPRVFDGTRAGSERYLLPRRIERYFGIEKVTLHSVVPDETCTRFAIYFDAAGSAAEEDRRLPGIVGDGDRILEDFGRRAIAASHFDAFSDFDGDGDLDLFKGGVEPYVHCYENAGGNRLVDRGRLTSGGELFILPRDADSNRSWVTVAFFDIDGDGDQDFLPSFMDGPDRGTFVFYRNVTRESGGILTFKREGTLRAASGIPLAGGPQAGGWFPSIAFIRGWDGDGRDGIDALVGSNNRCYLYRGLAPGADGMPLFAEAVALQAAGQDIAIVNPRFDCADIDGDGDLDLFAGSQPGPVFWFKNIGTRAKPELAPGIIVAYGGKYLIGDAHSGVKVADFDGDGLPDIAAGRLWERTDLAEPEAPRRYGGFFKNVGTREAPRFERRDEGGPYTEGFPICDAIRQNSVRAVDWDRDGRTDLLAGDTDGFVWLFQNRGTELFPLFSAGERLRAGSAPASVRGSGGHARLDLCDWDGDGERDLIVADGAGTVTLFRGEGGERLAAGRKIEAGGKPIQVGGRASVIACDWDGDGRTDLVVADEKGYAFLRNTGSACEPALDAPKQILFGGEPAGYVRPNLGSFVDWDGDGKRNLIGCEFENRVWLYRNTGSGEPGAEPRFAARIREPILDPKIPQMISGADAVDWNGDGDIDILTGQGHGGSGLRFYERDFLEDEIRGTRPSGQIERCQARPSDLEGVTEDAIEAFIARELRASRRRVEECTGLRIQALPGFRRVDFDEWKKIIETEYRDPEQDLSLLVDLTMALYFVKERAIVVPDRGPLLVYLAESPGDTRHHLDHEMAHHVSEEAFSLLSRLKAANQGMDKSRFRALAEGFAVWVEAATYRRLHPDFTEDYVELKCRNHMDAQFIRIGYHFLSSRFDAGGVKAIHEALATEPPPWDDLLRYERSPHPDRRLGSQSIPEVTHRPGPGEGEAVRLVWAPPDESVFAWKVAGKGKRDGQEWDLDSRIQVGLRRKDDLFELGIQQIHMRFRQGSREITYDCSKARLLLEEDGKRIREIVDGPEAPVAAWVTAPFLRIRFHPSGFFSEIQRGARNPLSAIMETAQAADILIGFTPKFPAEAVRVGDRWKTKLPFAQGEPGERPGTEQIDVEFEAQGYDAASGRMVLILEGKLPAAAEKDGESVHMKGRYEIDVHTGMPAVAKIQVEGMRPRSESYEMTVEQIEPKDAGGAD